MAFNWLFEKVFVTLLLHVFLDCYYIWITLIYAIPCNYFGFIIMLINLFTAVMGIKLWLLHLSFQVLQFVTRRLEQFLVCNLYIMEFLLNKTYASFHLPECFPYFFRFLFSAKNKIFNRKQGWYYWGIVLRLKPETPSPFRSCCLLCWAMTALAERHGFSTNSSQKFCLLFIVCLNTFILNKNVVNAWPVTANSEVEFL